MEPTRNQKLLKQVGNLIIWAVIILIELWLFSDMYYPFFASSEIIGYNFAKLFFMILVAWVGYRTLKPKKPKIV